MSNPYLDGNEKEESTPDVGPKSSGMSWQWLIAVVAVVALFLPPPGGWQSDWLPIPIPTPIDNKVDPAKTVGSWVILIEETEDRTVESAKIIGDLAYWRTLNDRGLNWRHYDDDSSEAKPFLKLAESVGYPAVLIIGAKDSLAGKLLGREKLTTKESLDALVKKATGR